MNTFVGIPEGRYQFCPISGTHTVYFFPKYGRSFSLSSDSLAGLTNLIDMFFAPRWNPNFTTLSSYKRAQMSSLEDTAVIEIDEEFLKAA